MNRDAPGRLLLVTAVSIVLLNVVVAQAIVQRLYPDSGLRIGPAALVVLAVVALACIAWAVSGWRAFLRKRPPDR